MSPPPDFAGDEARQKLNIVNIVKISQISLTALIRPRAALMLGLAPHPGRPLSELGPGARFGDHTQATAS